jgi:hypothetical protein
VSSPERLKSSSAVNSIFDPALSAVAPAFDAPVKVAALPVGFPSGPKPFMSVVSMCSANSGTAPEPAPPPAAVDAFPAGAFPAVPLSAKAFPVWIASPAGTSAVKGIVLTNSLRFMIYSAA